MPTNKIGLPVTCLHRQRRAAARVAVGLGQDHAGQAQCIVECLGGVDRILPRHAVDDEQPLMRIERRFEFA